MRIQWLGFALIFSTSAFAQFHGFGNPTPVLQGSFGNVVFPAGTAAIPGVTRFFPNVVFPAGNPPRLYVPGSVRDPTAISARFGRGNPGFNGGSGFNGGFVGSGGFVGTRGFVGSRSGSRSGAVVVPYAVPVYLGGYAGYTGYYDGSAPPDAAAAAGAGPSQPNVIVVYPSGAPAGAPPSGGYGEAYAPPVVPPAGPASAENQDQGTATPAQPTYLIAFKDHTIYSAVAYWVEGDTLHYFTSGATHNQVSLSLIDRDLTLRLNAEAGNNMQLPAN